MTKIKPAIRLNLLNIIKVNIPKNISTQLVMLKPRKIIIKMSLEFALTIKTNRILTYKLRICWQIWHMRMLWSRGQDSDDVQKITQIPTKQVTEASNESVLQTLDIIKKQHGRDRYVKAAAQSIGSLDLRSQFPPIQNQGSCGSCWAFTATSLVDNYSYKLGIKTKYSEQFVLDCSGAGRWAFFESLSELDFVIAFQSCNGGYQDAALYAIYSSGVATQADYGSYQSSNKNCKKSVPHQFKTSNACLYYPGDESKLLYVLNHYKVGVGVSIDVEPSFVSYSSGVYDDSRCSRNINSSNHAVVGLFWDLI